MTEKFTTVDKVGSGKELCNSFKCPQTCGWSCPVSNRCSALADEDAETDSDSTKAIRMGGVCDSEWPVLTVLPNKKPKEKVMPHTKVKWDKVELINMVGGN